LVRNEGRKMMGETKKSLKKLVCTAVRGGREMNRKLVTLSTVPVIIILLYTANVHGGMIELINQERYVQADIQWGDPQDPQNPGGGEDHALDSASDYGLFDSAVSVSLGTGWLWASASQLSEILGATVTASGSADSGGVDLWAGATGVSSFSLTFDLIAQQEFSIAGSLSADGLASNAGILFTGPAGTILDESVSPKFWWDPPMHAVFSISGTLDPGRYTLSAWSITDAHSSEMPTASFSFEGVIPEPSTVVLLALGMGYLIAANKGRKKRS
jgi:hypothetical protein